jgi:hypothetical protein
MLRSLEVQMLRSLEVQRLRSLGENTVFADGV